MPADVNHIRILFCSRNTFPLESRRIAGVNIDNRGVGSVRTGPGCRTKWRPSSLVASQIAGMLLARYVLQLPALAAASVDDIVARVGPTVQHYMTDGIEKEIR